MPLRLITGTPPALEQCLAKEVAGIQADDPLASVGVLLGGTLQRPYLQRRLAELNDGIANVRFLMPSELAIELGEQAQIADGRRPLPPLADRILLREVGAEHDGYFEPVRDAPGLAEAFHRLVRELRGAGYDAGTFPPAVADACEVPAKADALAEIYTEFLRRRRDFYGPDDCLLSAEPERSSWRALLVFGLWQAPAALIELLVLLKRQLPVTVLLPTTGAADADWAHQDLRALLLAAGAEEEAVEVAEDPASTLVVARTNLFRIPDEPAAIDSSLRLISGPDPAREVREVARGCLGWARDGIQFHEMAIAYRHSDPYRSLIESVFIEAGVPIYLHEATPMSEHPLGRRVIALLDLIDSDLERRSVIDFLSDGRLPQRTWEDSGKASFSTWDRYSRRAGVVRGLDQWEQRLEAYRVDLASSDREWSREDAPKVAAFLGFIRDLAKDLDGYPRTAPWSVHLAYLERLLRRYVDDPTPILESLAGLARFAALGEQTTFERFRQAVKATIENLRIDQTERGRAGAFGLRGINVLDVNSMRHLGFRAVAIVGVAERTFPAPPSPDPILLDHERERLNANGPASIPLRVRGADSEPLQFAVAAYAARERLLVSYARKGTADSRPQLPSRFFRALAEAVVAKRVSAEEVDRLPGPLYERASGSRIGARDTEVAISLDEYDRTLIERDPDLGRAALSRVEPRFKRALEARRARVSRQLTEFDGVLGQEARDLLDQIFDPRNGVSPSLLQGYATCPQQVFVNNVLGVRVDEEPEQMISLEPGDRGTLLHKILERFLAEPPRDREELLHGPGEEARLLAIAEQEFDLCQERGRTGYPAFWASDRLELIEDLKAWLANERLDEQFSLLSEGAYEVRFGYGYGDSESDGGLSTDDPIEISAGKAKLKVSGRIDRLNWDPDSKRFRVVDYKTGAVYEKPADGNLEGGKALQLPIYMLAAARMLSIRPRGGEAAYHYSTRRGKFERGRFTGQDFAARRADLELILSEMLSGMRAGIYPMAVRELGECTYCAANSLCPASRLRIIERKGGDPTTAGLERMREIE